MFRRAVALCSAVLIAAILLPAGRADAQLFSSKWSGFGGAPAQSRPMRTARPLSSVFTLRSSPLRGFSRWSPYNARSYQSRGGDGGEDWNGNYRTLCVRMCDGYYFPVSYRATRGRMYRDSKICESSCDCETKLFYLPSSSSDIKQATDLSGQSYSRLENAFAYRTAWNASCTCRPVAWSDQEKIRHEQYAYADTERKAEIVSHKGEALVALIEREDAKEAVAEAARIANREDKARKELAQMQEALPEVALILAKPHAVEETQASAVPEQAAGPDDHTKLASAEATESSVEPSAVAVDRVPEFGQLSAFVNTPPKRGAGRSAGRANRGGRVSPVKVSRIKNRGFWQM